MKTKVRFTFSLAILIAFVAAFTAASVPVFQPQLFAALAGWFVVFALIEIARVGQSRVRRTPRLATSRLVALPVSSPSLERGRMTNSRRRRTEAIAA